MKNTTILSVHAQLLFAVLIFIGSVCPSNAQQNPEPNAVPAIQMTDVPLSRAIDVLAKQSGLNYVIDPTLSSDHASLLSFRWTNITARAALDRMLKEHDFDLVENPATTVARIAPHKLHVKPVDPALVGTDTNAEVVPMIMMADAPLEQAVTLFASQAHMNIAFEEGLFSEHMVSFRWKHLTARQALVALLDCYNFTLVENPSTQEFRIKPKPQTAAKP